MMIDSHDKKFFEYIEKEFFERTGKKISIVEASKDPSAFKDFTIEDHKIYSELLKKSISHIKVKNKKLAKIGALTITITTLTTIMFFYTKTIGSFVCNLSVGAIMFYIFFREYKSLDTPDIKK